MLVAYERDGKPLPDESGPFRLVVPQDTRTARWVFKLTFISVRSAR